MISRRFLLIGGCMTAIAGCGGRQEPNKFLSYDGPQVTSVVLFKEERTMYLLHHEQVLRSYLFDLGFQPYGHKQFEGDGRTPEGAYLIDRRNPNSSYHLSIGVSYPNTNDKAFAESLGQKPGGDIFIHGTPNRFSSQPDWTAGCIAVSNPEMEEIYAMVRDWTPIFIYPRRAQPDARPQPDIETLVMNEMADTVPDLPGSYGVTGGLGPQYQ